MNELENLNMPPMEAEEMPEFSEKHLRVLRRRANYLDDLIKRTDEECPSLSYDKAERSALRWAIEFIENS